MHNLCNIIIDALDEYLSGSAGKAYDKIEYFFSTNIVQEHIRYLIKPVANHNGSNKSLYRVRYSESDLKDRSHLFHIPFHMRNLVGTQRYSIAGLPCLYLGTSLYVCWQEMGKPDLNKLFLSRYTVQPNENVKVLNFAYSLETLKHTNLEDFMIWDYDQNDIRLHIAYIVFLPLLIACSYNRAFEKANFHAEYIIPNLLLQWISKEKSNVCGISYYSTKTKQLRHSKIGVNFVFPPDTNSVHNEGFCKQLSSQFYLTKPVSWQVLDTINEAPNIINETFSFSDDIEEGFVENYSATKFHKVEKFLNDKLKVDSVNA